MTFYKKDIFKITLGRGSALVLETFLLKKEIQKPEHPTSFEELLLLKNK